MVNDTVVWYGGMVWWYHTVLLLWYGSGTIHEAVEQENTHAKQTQNVRKYGLVVQYGTLYVSHILMSCQTPTLTLGARAINKGWYALPLYYKMY